MVYDFHKEIVNRNDVSHFYNKNNFVGYILPDGSIYQCKNHNVSNAETVISMYLMILNDNYEFKETLMNIETDDKLLQIITKHLIKMSHDEIVALIKFINENNLLVSDLIVSLFGCHLVTRLDKTILTSETNHEYFYNYLLNDFKICMIDKIYYDSNNKTFRFIKSINRNDYLYDEIENIKKMNNVDDIELFYKSR